MDRSCCHTLPRARTNRGVQTELCFAPKPSIGIGTRRRQTILASEAPELGVDGAWGVGLLRGHSRTLAPIMQPPRAVRRIGKMGPSCGLLTLPMTESYPTSVSSSQRVKRESFATRLTFSLE